MRNTRDKQTLIRFISRIKHESAYSALSFEQYFVLTRVFKLQADIMITGDYGSGLTHLYNVMLLFAQKDFLPIVTYAARMQKPDAKLVVIEEDCKLAHISDADKRKYVIFGHDRTSLMFDRTYERFHLTQNFYDISLYNLTFARFLHHGEADQHDIENASFPSYKFNKYTRLYAEYFELEEEISDDKILTLDAENSDPGPFAEYEVEFYAVVLLENEYGAFWMNNSASSSLGQPSIQLKHKDYSVTAQVIVTDESSPLYGKMGFIAKIAKIKEGLRLTVKIEGYLVKFVVDGSSKPVDVCFAAPVTTKFVFPEIILDAAAIKGNFGKHLAYLVRKTTGNVSLMDDVNPKYYGEPLAEKYNVYVKVALKVRQSLIEDTTITSGLFDYPKSQSDLFNFDFANQVERKRLPKQAVLFYNIEDDFTMQRSQLQLYLYLQSRPWIQQCLRSRVAAYYRGYSFESSYSSSYDYSDSGSEGQTYWNSGWPFELRGQSASELNSFVNAYFPPQVQQSAVSFPQISFEPVARPSPPVLQQPFRVSPTTPPAPPVIDLASSDDYQPLAPRSRAAPVGECDPISLSD